MQQLSKVHNLWGFSATNGQMFFNVLYNNSEDHEDLASLLRAMLPVPKDRADAVSRMTDFDTYVDTDNQRLENPRARAARNSAPFFLSYFWNVQEEGRHPIYFPSAVRGLALVGFQYLYEFEAPADRYDAYYELMTMVRRAYEETSMTSLGFTPAEDFLWWRANQDYQTGSDVETASGSSEQVETAPPELESTHTEMQWMLSRIGRLRGLKVHVASNDVNRVWKKERLGDVGGDALPLPGYRDEERKVIERIDVVWFKQNDITHMFEIESTTPIITGLLRMSDLLYLQPHLHPALFIIVPSERVEEARRILERPSIRRIKKEGVGRRLDVRTFEEVRANFSLEHGGGAIH